jgi:hypothetical protein
MSKCDLKIEFDRANRTYRGGDEPSGTVHVQVNRDVRCDGLLVEHFWQTHGRGNTAAGEKQTTVLFQGDWQAGQSFSYPFRFKAPHGPPTYHGHYLNVDHYIQARVDIPWAIDPKHKEEYLLLPSEREYGNLPPSRDQQHKLKQQITKLGLPIGVAMVVLGFLCFFPFGLVLIPIGLIVLFATLRKSLAEKKIGKVELQWGSLRVAPGGTVPLALSFTPRKSSVLKGITAELVATEQCVSGSGTNKTTHTHKVHQQTVTLARQGQVTAGKPIQLSTGIAIPKTDAFSFSASDNDLTWSVEVRVDIPLWPDWVEKKVLTVRPAPAAGLVDRQPPAPPLVAKSEPPTVEAPDAPDAAGMTVSSGSELTMQPAPTGPPAEEPLESAPPAPEQQPAARAPALDSVLKEIVGRLGSASRYGSERDDIVREYADESLACTIEIDNIERTYGSVPDERFRNGRTVTGVIADSDCEVSLLLPGDRNEELDALGPGDTLEANCRLLKWNNIYDRLEMHEA